MLGKFCSIFFSWLNTYLRTKTYTAASTVLVPFYIPVLDVNPSLVLDQSSYYAPCSIIKRLNSQYTLFIFWPTIVCTYNTTPSRFPDLQFYTIHLAKPNYIYIYIYEHIAFFFIFLFQNTLQ